MPAEQGAIEISIEVLVVDDSPLMQRLITRLIESDPAIRVIDTASDGVEAVQKTAAYHPDVVTLDIEMPQLNGLGALQMIMERTPTPVVMVSAMDEADTVMRALELGAVDFVSKPSGTVSIDLYKVRDEMIRKIKLATFTRPRRGVQVERPGALPRAPRTEMMGVRSGKPRIVAVGASTGGPRAIGELVTALPPELPVTICVVQHMPIGFTRSFAERLDRQCSLHVVEAEEGQVVEPGGVYVAPGGSHMVLARQGERLVVALTQAPAVHSVRPSIDVLMQSVADVGGRDTLGILLTGMGSDGVEGLAAIKAAGGTTIVQDRETSTIFGMPRAAIQRGVADQILPLSQIPGALMLAMGIDEDEEQGRGTA